MPIDKRVDHKVGSAGSLGTAPYLAKIVNFIDPQFQGGFEVSLLRTSGNQIADENQTYEVKYASPFYGTTAYEFMGKNVTHDDTQKSYGFWGIPPDVGVTGIVIFIEGKPDAGYWLCCVQDKFVNHMIPAIGGTKIYKADEDLDQAEHPLPVSEHNRKANEMDKNLEIDKIPRAVHPIAKRFKTQGLIRDEFRGTTTSTSRRDLPNLVFGMSSPGPLDRNGKKANVGNKQSPALVPVSRLGGTQFVMDDGDDRYFREKTPSEGPPIYLDEPAGDTDIPYSEYFRIRTRTGHQFLLHNSEDLIYIANSRGTAWVEITSDGKIDVFSTDSINLRTKQDFNFYADRDFNMEIMRNFNLKVHGEMHTKVIKDQIVIVDRDQKIHVKRRKDETIDEQYRQTVNADVKKYYATDYSHNVDGRTDFRIAKGISVTAGKGASGSQFAPWESTRQDPEDPMSTDQETSSPVKDHNGPTPDRVDLNFAISQRTTITGDLDINVTGHVFTTSGGNNETLAGPAIIETAGVIHMNGPTASTASASEEARVSAKATIPLNLKTHKLPDLVTPSAKDDPIDLISILRRVPTPEAYPHHENLNPKQFKPTEDEFPGLDRDILDRYHPASDDTPTEDLREPPPEWKKYKKPGDNPF